MNSPWRTLSGCADGERVPSGVAVGGDCGPPSLRCRRQTRVHFDRRRSLRTLSQDSNRAGPPCDLELLSWLQASKPDERPLFVTRDGRPATAGNLRNRFQRLRVLAGVQSRNGTRCEPRMHDLRPSFAVHRIAAWIKSGSDLNRMPPALAAYMGLVGLTATERFIALTPERFRKELSKLSPGQAKRHWRDDPQLMKFLAAL